MRRVQILAQLAFVFALTVSVSASAIPLGIRAKTRITLEAQRNGPGLDLVGRIVDDQGDPIGGQPVTLAIPHSPPAANQTRDSEPDGTFTFRIDALTLDTLTDFHSTKIPWTVRFDGDRRFGSASATGVIDLGKSPTRLVLSLSRTRLARDRRPVDATVTLMTAESDPHPIGPFDVRLSVGDGAELVGTTGSNGRATFVIESQVLTRAGHYRVAARFLGDRHFAPSQAEAEIEVVLPTRLTLRVAREGDLRSGRFRFSGRLADENGPIVGAVVAVRGTLTDEGAPAPSPRGVGSAARSATNPAGPANPTNPANPKGPAANSIAPAFSALAVTDADGVWVAALPAHVLQDLDRPNVDVSAQYTPADGVHEPARSLPVLLEIPTAPGVPLAWYAGAFGVALLGLGLGRAVRQHGFSRALAWVRARFARKPALAAGTTEADPAFVTALAPSGARPRRTDLIAGRVVDAHGRIPLARARVRLGALHAVTAADGSFMIGGGTTLPSGEVTLAVDAPGYLAREVALTLPHRGDYDGVELALVAVRRRVREVFVDALARFQARVRWGHDTPREAARPVHAVLTAEGVDPIAELTVLVERAHFGAVPATAEDLAEAKRWREKLEAP